ncbi:MAG TPA: DUF3499 family protein [Microthrixaceae bacterium]|nr:DUF3499 family protein [Microthrixaceae bacterium]
MTRICARPGCRQSAVSTLSYAYDDRLAWIDALAPQAHPMTHDLCPEHTDGLRVPRGWSVRDSRQMSEHDVDDHRISA